jgi:hypothetical protein
LENWVAEVNKAPETVPPVLPPSNANVANTNNTPNSKIK